VAEELGLEEVFDFVEDLARSVYPLIDFLRDLVVGGVESIKTDMSESLWSSGADFCFFFAGDGDKSMLSLFLEFSFGDSGYVGLTGDLTFAFAGDDSGVACITAFLRRAFLANINGDS
jgi:hypothetical protein